MAVFHGVGTLDRDFLFFEVAEKFKKLAVGNAKAKLVLASSEMLSCCYNDSYYDYCPHVGRVLHRLHRVSSSLVSWLCMCLVFVLH